MHINHKPSAFVCADPVLKEAAANAAGSSATVPSSAPAEGEQEMKDNGELLQNTGSQ